MKRFTVTLALAVVFISGCATLSALFSPYNDVPGWGARYSGDLPAAETPEKLAHVFNAVALTYPSERFDEIHERLGGVTIWFRTGQLVMNQHTGKMHPGLFHAPNTIEIPVGDRLRFGDTSLTYELFRVLHYIDHRASLSSAAHQVLYGDKIKLINDAIRR